MCTEYHGGWAKLAAAIIVTGIQENDVSFLNSEWCSLLRAVCEVDYEYYNGRDNGIPRVIPQMAAKTYS